jgi:hypothetical protein
VDALTDLHIGTGASCEENHWEIRESVAGTEEADAGGYVSGNKQGRETHEGRGCCHRC